MNKLIKSVILAIILILAVPVYAANTIDVSNDGLTITISNIDSDWTWTDNFTHAKYAAGIRVNYIRFHPGATDDICSIGDSDDAEVYHFYAKCADTYDDRIQYYSGSKLKLKLTVANGTYSTTDDILTIQLWPTQEP
jgi:hypothetical protein